jgi:hypothetical protein
MQKSFTCLDGVALPRYVLCQAGVVLVCPEGPCHTNCTTSKGCIPARRNLAVTVTATVTHRWPLTQQQASQPLSASLVAAAAVCCCCCCSAAVPGDHDIVMICRQLWTLCWVTQQC